MNISYNVVEQKTLNIDFETIYKYIKNENPYQSIFENYELFIENVVWYITEIYHCDDLEEFYNEDVIEDIVMEFENWLDATFGEDWNK